MAHTPTKKHTAKNAPPFGGKGDHDNSGKTGGARAPSDQPESPVPESEAERQEIEAERAREEARAQETWGERQARESIEAERELARSGRSPQTDIKQDEGQK